MVNGRNSRWSRVLWALAGALITGSAAAETIIHAGRLIDVTGETVLTERSIVIDGDRIERVEAGYQQAAGARIIDLKGATVMPGWLDMHVHIGSEQSPRRQVEAFTTDLVQMAVEDKLDPRIV